ncbi:MAG: hypothetical protein AAFP23_00515, partial [Pseudomonadota bacterium]
MSAVWDAYAAAQGAITGLGLADWILPTLLVLLAAAAISWVFRALVIAIAGATWRPILKSMPLTASFGLLVVLLYAIVAIFAPLIAPFGEREIVGGEYLPWDSTHLLGTDNLGRDMLSRLIYGAQNTVGIAFATTFLGFVIGAVPGLIAATLGGWVDQGLSRLVDILMAIPPLIFAL